MQLTSLLIYIYIYIDETHIYMLEPCLNIVLPQVLAEYLREAFGDSADEGRATGALSSAMGVPCPAGYESVRHADTDSFPAGQATPPCWKCPDDESSDESSEPAFVM
jgi:hypothetical protein